MSIVSNYDVIIAGGGPAGASAATHLATRGARVLLAEQKKFPRPKLCGEFISPECAAHFERLGVADQMFAARPSELTQTVFYSRNGSKVSVPSSWFQNSGVALGLSRSEMDERLLRRAAAAGAQVVEEAHVTSLIVENEIVCGLKMKIGADEMSYRAPVTIDATGRARSLTRQVNKRNGHRERRPMVAFKAHFENARVETGACEIYFYPGGYGGLSSIEGGLSNLCFIASARDVRACGADANRVMREVICKNRRAHETLRDAHTASSWLAVALEGFGRHSVAPMNGLLAIGDAASFIDPFTGSGMLMALESGELAADITADHLAAHPQALDSLRTTYASAYAATFDARLRTCSLLRKAAFIPGLAEIAIRFFGASDGFRRRLARATRGRAAETYSLVKRVR
jgi:flavin-dependent dehydrogenase